MHQQSDLTQLWKVALRAVCSVMPKPAKSKVVLWFIRSLRHGCKVKEKKGHTMQRPFLNLWVTDTLATQSYNQLTMTAIQSFFFIFFFFFRPFQHPEPRAPCLTSTAENPTYQTANKSYLLLPRDLECDQAYFSLIVSMISMTGPCLILLTWHFMDYEQLKQGSNISAFTRMKSRYWYIWNIFIDLLFLRVLSTAFIVLYS